MPSKNQQTWEQVEEGVWETYHDALKRKAVVFEADWPDLQHTYDVYDFKSGKYLCADRVAPSVRAAKLAATKALLRGGK